MLEILSQYGYLVLVFAVVLMNAGVPVPGHAAYLAASVLAGHGTLALPLVIGVSAPAAVAGAAAGFYLGRRGGRRLVEAYGPRVGLSPPRLLAMDRFFDRHGAKAVFLTRFFLVIRHFGAVLAGVNRVPVVRFLVTTTAGALVWAVGYGLFGFFFGERWSAIERWLGSVGLAVLAVLVLAYLAHVLFTRRRKRV